MKYQMRAAIPADLDDILVLFPRLADFEIPDARQPEHLWQGDADVLRSWAAGKNSDCRVFIASASGIIAGAAMFQFRPELLSQAPSAHLETLVVAKEAEGHGIGKALISACEACAKTEGATTLTLTVFTKNLRARELYERTGFEGELIRYIKTL